MQPPYPPPPYGQPPPGQPHPLGRPYPAGPAFPGPPGGPQYPGGPPRKSWLQRHLGWVVALGCLGVMVLGVGFFVSVFGVVMMSMKSSDAYSMAMGAAVRSPLVRAELGAPIEAGWFVSGSINTSGAGGHADLSIPLSGSTAAGTLHAVANKAGGTWTFSTLNVQVDGKPTAIDLLPTLPSP